jgi:FkbM family methyltransferase
MERRLERAVRTRHRQENRKMSGGFAFDQPHYKALNKAREAVLRPLLTSLGESVDLRTVVDVGCGLGYFSAVMTDLGFEVLALDGRPENVDEARRRYREIKFRVGDAEDQGVRSLGEFDIVLCLGLLYHLENPFIAIRNLFELTRKVAILEGMCFPDERPILAIRDEGSTEDQGLRYVALYPSESALIKLLYRAGFLYVYQLKTKPLHPEFRSSSTRHFARTFLVASRVPLSSGLLKVVTEPATSVDPWAIHGTAARVARFLRKPWKEKAAALCYRWVQRFPAVPVPVHLPFGGWWLARNDFVGAAIFNGGFENIERSFVERFLRPGMTVLDIGAHHGFYTLLASRKVGADGRVLAVEASPRERKKLGVHLRINGCKNVQVESCALGDADGDAQLYLVKGGQTGCNSLRKPETSEPTEAVPIHVGRLDDVLRDHQIEKVDFVKLDVEGAELSVLRGAPQLLRNRPRPAILAEVQDIRTKPWGYPARDIIRYLAAAEYRWFRPLSDGGLERIDAEREKYDGNFVAVPEERLASLGV